jgi:hypothetical protein
MVLCPTILLVSNLDTPSPGRSSCRRVIPVVPVIFAISLCQGPPWSLLVGRNPWAPNACSLPSKALIHLNHLIHLIHLVHHLLFHMFLNRGNMSLNRGICWFRWIKWNITP